MSLWISRSLPVLQWVADHEGSKTLASLAEVGDVVGLSPEQVDSEVERLLHDGLMTAEVVRPLNGGDAAGWFVATPRLTGQGARALGEWPDGAKLLEVIEHMAEHEQDSEKRSKLQTAAGALRQVGTTVVGEMLVAYLKSQGHLP